MTDGPLTPSTPEAEEHDRLTTERRQDTERLESLGFLKLRADVLNVARAVEALDPSAIETAIRAAEKRKRELETALDGQGDPDAIAFEVLAMRVVLDARRELLTIAKRQESRAKVKAGIRDRLPGRR